MDPLIASLKRVRRRLVVVRAAEAGLAGAGAAAVAALLVMLLRILLPTFLPAALGAPLAPLVFVPAGFAAAFIVRAAAGVSLRRAAVAADRAAGLKECLATALEVLDARGGPGGWPPGVLDERLLAEARAAAAALEPSRLRLARSAGRRGRAVLVMLVALLGGAFVPSIGGPRIASHEGRRAADALGRAAETVALAPALRDRIERTVARLRGGSAQQGEVDRATAELYRAVVEAGRRRADAARALAIPADPKFRAMVEAGHRGDGVGAAAAASDLGGRLRSDPGSGGMPLEDRQRLAADLDGAAAEAKKAGLADLGDGLHSAADAARQPDERTGDAFRSLAATVTQALGGAPGGTVAVALSGVRQARVEAGLAPEPPPKAPAPGAPVPPELPVAGAANGGPGPRIETGTGSAAVAIPPEVRPEDRDVVRRYFND